MTKREFQKQMLRATWYGVIPPGLWWPPVHVGRRLRLTWEILKVAR